MNTAISVYIVLTTGYIIVWNQHLFQETWCSGGVQTSETQLLSWHRWSCPLWRSLLQEDHFPLQLLCLVSHSQQGLFCGEIGNKKTLHIAISWKLHKQTFTDCCFCTNGCNKRFSLVQFGGLKPRAFLESSTLQVCQSYPLSLLDPMRKFCSCRSGSLSPPLYPALPRMQPVAVARKLKVTEYCSSPLERTRREAAFASFQTVYILEQFPGHSSLKTLPSGKETAAHTECKSPPIALHTANFLLL